MHAVEPRDFTHGQTNAGGHIRDLIAALGYSNLIGGIGDQSTGIRRRAVGGGGLGCGCGVEAADLPAQVIIQRSITAGKKGQHRKRR